MSWEQPWLGCSPQGWRSGIPRHTHLLVLDVGTRPLGAVAVRGQGGGESGHPFTEARAGCALLSLTPGQTPLFFQPVSSLVGRQRAEQLPGVPEDQ